MIHTCELWKILWTGDCEATATNVYMDSTVGKILVCDAHNTQLKPKVK